MSALSEFLRPRLKTADSKSLNDASSPPWFEEGVTVQVDEATYMRHLEVLPPRYISGLLFAYGEGAGNFTLFWQIGEHYFAHMLSAIDTERFCELSETSLYE
jgi:hypothetical protein